MPRSRRLAISIRQPYVEQIFRALKKEEYRSRPTNIRGRVYVYASLQPGKAKDFKRINAELSELPTGVIVGSVEVVGCRYSTRYECYAYKLANPKRLARPIWPKRRPQPVWFHPF
jgi:ASCH domain-containing protein